VLLQKLLPDPFAVILNLERALILEIIFLKLRSLNLVAFLEHTLLSQGLLLKLFAELLRQTVNQS
jgi:hypothetical protein